MNLPPSLPARVFELAAERPDGIAIREKRYGVWQEYTYREYLDRITWAARMFQELGVREGDHVAILSDNRPEWLFADLAAQALGARAVGIYQTNPPGDVAFILNDAGCRVVVCEDQEQHDKLALVASDTPSVEHVIVVEPRGTRDTADPRLRTWERFLEQGRLLAEGEPGWLEAQLRARDPEAPAMAVYTSGTTGPPKGALLSSRNVLTCQRGLARELGIGPADSVVSYLPLCHVAEKIFTLFFPLTTGGVVHFGESIETVQADLAEVAPTVFLGVPRIWEKMHARVLVKAQDASWLKRTLFNHFTRVGRQIAERRLRGETRWTDRVTWAIGDLLVYRPLQERLGLRRCRLAISGAAPISPELLAWFHGVGIRILEGYGQTECAGVSHLNRPSAPRLGTVGTTVAGMECRIAPDGEVLVRGPNVFVGYLNRPDATAEVITEDGWLRTGDIGEVDADGYLRITGRKKEILITSGGKNLSPEKIENALKISPYIKEAVAIGDNRRFVSALIQVDGDTVSDWAVRRRIPFTSYADLTQRPEVQKLIAGEVDRANEQLANVEQVRAFRILPRELNQDDGEVTATQKVRRRAVLTAYGTLIEGIYGSGAR